MSQAAFADTAEFYRVDAALKLDPVRRSDLGQYMTPAPIARFMASLFADVSGDIRLLDPGAGVGSLTAAFVERICAAAAKPRSVSLAAYEIEPVLSAYLRNTLVEAVAQCRRAQIKASTALHEEDFILGHAWGIQPDIFNRGIMGRYLGEISWETEVWCANAPTHLIHFNGERFLGPYEKGGGQ